MTCRLLQEPLEGLQPLEVRLARGGIFLAVGSTSRGGCDGILFTRREGAFQHWPSAQAAIAGLCPVFQLETSCAPPLSDSYPPGESCELSVCPPHVRPDGDKMLVILWNRTRGSATADNLCSCLSSPRYPQQRITLSRGILI